MRASTTSSVSLLLFAASLTACGGGGGGAPTTTPPPVAICDESREFCGTIPGSADACSDSQYWPLSVSSSLRPVTVHFPRLSNEAKAQEIVGLIEESWNIQVDTMGFTAPLSDQGQCGADNNYDVFIWPDTGGAFVDGVANNPATPHQDWSTYMAIDIAGSTGGALLNTFIAHEFNHALQASDDWAEDGQHYEAGATLAEALVYPDDRDWYFTQRDFQNNPDWSLFYDDALATWYSYGSAIYLHFIYERYFPADPAFYSRLWRGTRSDTPNGRPDYIDALRNLLLLERGVTLDEAIIEFMQWRWFVGDEDDGAHFERGAAWPHEVAVTEIDSSELPSTEALDAMVYGANYLRITNNGGATIALNTMLGQSDPDVVWRLYAVEGGEVMGPIDVAPGESAAVVAVLLPSEEVWTQNLSFERSTATLDISVIP